MNRKEKFTPGEHYHICSRIISQSPEFSASGNAQKLCQTFLLANSTKSSQAFDYLRCDKNANIEHAIEIANQGEKLVDVLCYAVMLNHYHLLLKEIKENGITDFIRKCNTSIAKYINIKNDRRGPLFESKFKSKHVSSNEYLIHLSVYINLNPLDFLVGKEWREHKLKNWKSIRQKLLDYPWSSSNFFLNQNNKDKILSGMEIILDQFNDHNNYEKFLQDWSMEQLDDKDKKMG